MDKIVPECVDKWMEEVKKDPSIATNREKMGRWFFTALSNGYDACYNKYKHALTEDVYADTKQKCLEIEKSSL